MILARSSLLQMALNINCQYMSSLCDNIVSVLFFLFLCLRCRNNKSVFLFSVLATQQNEYQARTPDLLNGFSIA
jgi:hypothetical protein